MSTTEDIPIIIRPIGESDSIAELTDLLHRAYKHLADMGLKFFATHQTEEQTRERLANGACLLGILGDRIVATITYYSPAGSKGTDWYNRPDVAYFGQFAVDPTLQRSGIGTRLLNEVESMARADGAAELGLDTAETATHLIDYYGRRGYRHVGHAQWDVTNYRSVIMSKKLG